MKKCPNIKYELKANTKFPLQLIYKIQIIAKNLELKMILRFISPASTNVCRQIVLLVEDSNEERTFKVVAIAWLVITSVVHCWASSKLSAKNRLFKERTIYSIQYSIFNIQDKYSVLLTNKERLWGRTVASQFTQRMSESIL